MPITYKFESWMVEKQSHRCTDFNWAIRQGIVDKYISNIYKKSFKFVFMFMFAGDTPTLGLKLQGLGLKPHGLGLKPHGLGLKAHGLGLKPHGLVLKPHG